MSKKRQASPGSLGNLLSGERTALLGWSKTRVLSVDGQPEREESQFWIARELLMAVIWLLIMFAAFGSRS